MVLGRALRPALALGLGPSPDETVQHARASTGDGPLCATPGSPKDQFSPRPSDWTHLWPLDRPQAHPAVPRPPVGVEIRPRPEPATCNPPHRMGASTTQSDWHTKNMGGSDVRRAGRGSVAKPQPAPLTAICTGPSSRRSSRPTTSTWREHCGQDDGATRGRNCTGTSRASDGWLKSR